MKTSFVTLLLTTAFTAFPASLIAGSISTNQPFAVRNGITFNNTSLDTYEGKILVIMMMTPWCPFCQSNASAVGDGILDHFNATSRGTLRGKNNNGIEIDSILLSTEPASNWDNTNSSFATTNGYEQWGLDADAARANPRTLLGYYRGGYPSGVNSSNLYDWGNDRRRVVVLNMQKNSVSHSYREIIINQNAFDSSHAAGAQALINSIAAPPAVRTFSQWTSGYSFPFGMSGAQHDPDKDGTTNLLEFFHGTHPLQASSRDAGPSLVRDGTSWKFVYRMARNIGGFSVEHRSSANLTNWLALSSSLPQTVTPVGAVDQISVTLPSSSDSTRYYQLAVVVN